MCGLAGILFEATAGRDAGAFATYEHVEAAALEHPELARHLLPMLSALAHRGPDGEGALIDRSPGKGSGEGLGLDLALGHRRLSIIGLGSVGAQPMTAAGGRFSLAWNGAIYNYRELGAELGLPSPRSDTAVLLAAWAAWGPACLPRLVGMFAAAVWDREERALYLFRDRFGEKPLFYATPTETAGPARLVFASEMKGLFASGLVPPRLAEAPLVEFLASHRIDHDEETQLFAGIKQVPAGCVLRLGRGAKTGEVTSSLSRYFALTPPPREAADRLVLSPRELGELVEQAGTLLREAVALTLRSDAPRGGTLSGGLDSSTVTALAVRALPAGERYPVFSVQYPEIADPDRRYAEQVAAALSLTPTRITPSAEDFLRDLDAVLYHQEAPFGDPSICAHYALLKQVAAAGVKVLLTGQGGDEVFGGYGSYVYARGGMLLQHGPRGLPVLLREVAAHRRQGTDSTLRLLLGAGYHALPPALTERLHGLRRRGLYPLSARGEQLFHEAAPRFTAALPGLAGPGTWGRFDRYLVDALARFALPHILRHEDRNAMACSVESRAPLLDHRLATLLFKSPAAARVSGGYTKRLLREITVGILPEPVRLRPDKRGFHSPQAAWLRAAEPAVRASAEPLPSPLAELTDRQRHRELCERFFRGGEDGLSSAVFAGFVVSRFLHGTMARFLSLHSAACR